MKPILLILSLLVTLSASARISEVDLINSLQSTNWQTVQDALADLPKKYPSSAGGVAAVRALLHRNPSNTITVFSYKDTRDVAGYRQVVASDKIARACVWSLADYKITTTEADLDDIFNQLILSRTVDSALHGLKALRKMNATNAVPRLIPLLNDRNVHIQRDTIRTLAVLGDASLFPLLDKFMHPERVHNRNNQFLFADARDAIKKLKSKK